MTMESSGANEKENVDKYLIQKVASMGIEPEELACLILPIVLRININIFRVNIEKKVSDPKP